MSRFLPKVFRTIFAVIAVLSACVALGILIVMLVNPTLPPDARVGPVEGEFLGQPATLVLQPDASGQGEHVLTAQAFNGSVTMTVNQSTGAIERLKKFGLPLLLIRALFFAALFELLRRLFRNVGRGESFTPQSVRLVQVVGGALIVFAFISAVGDSAFAHAMYGYLSEHTQIAVSGMPIQLPLPEHHSWFGRFPLRSPVFFCGLLVLALAEVFRQGLALQHENDLTV